MSCHRIANGVVDIVPHFKPGDLPPEGYGDRIEWAAVQMRAGLRQLRCQNCLLWLFPQQAKVHKCGEAR